MATAQTASRSARLLLESGALESNRFPGGGSGDLVLSRALCRFRLYEPPHSLGRGRVARAARIHAEAHAPFDDSGMLLLRQGAGIGIWYWDRSKIKAGIPARRISPESVWRTAADGWRIIACSEGFEAQYWERQSLLASTWRRQHFTAAQWKAFTLSVSAPVAAPPDDPPAPEISPNQNTNWRAKVLREPLGWRHLEATAGVAALCAVCIVAVFCGRALKFESISRTHTERAISIEQGLRADRHVVRAREHLQLLQRAQSVMASTRVLSAAAQAQQVLDQFGLSATTWRVNASELSFIVDAPVSDAPVREVVSAFEQAPHICQATPEIAGGGRFEIRAAIETPGAACAEPSERQLQ